MMTRHGGHARCPPTSGCPKQPFEPSATRVGSFLWTATSATCLLRPLGPDLHHQAHHRMRIVKRRRRLSAHSYVTAGNVSSSPLAFSRSTASIAACSHAAYVCTSSCSLLLVRLLEAARRTAADCGMSSSRAQVTYVPDRGGGTSGTMPMFRTKGVQFRACVPCFDGVPRRAFFWPRLETRAWLARIPGHGTRSSTPLCPSLSPRSVRSATRISPRTLSATAAKIGRANHQSRFERQHRSFIYLFHSLASGFRASPLDHQWIASS